jgi:hypothetical protein
MLAICVGAAILGGCAQTTIQFKAPKGTRMAIGGKTYTWPADVVLARPQSSQTPKVHDLKLLIPLARGAIKAKGEIQMFGYVEQDVDRYAVNECTINDERIRQLRDGHAIIIRGFSASNQLIYKLLLGREQCSAVASR